MQPGGAALAEWAYGRGLKLNPDAIRDEFLDVQGIRIHFQRAGSGPALVLVHGLVGSVVNWRRNIGALAEVATVYALDLANMGRSERVPGLDPGMAATAERVIAFMDAVGVDKADVAGHSHGGTVAMMLAARHPGRVRSLVLFSPANPFANLGNVMVRVFRTWLGYPMAHLAPHLPRGLQRFILRRVFGDPRRMVEGTLEGYTDGLHVPGTVDHILGIFRCWFEDMAALEGELGRLDRVPTLLVAGGRDPIVGIRSIEKLSASDLGVCRTRVLIGAGHLTFEEDPETCNQIVVEWLAKVSTGRYF